MRFEWGNAPDFAEVAEALQINTTQVFAATVADNVLIVIYTPDQDGKPPFWRASMERDADGILVVKGAPVVLDTPDQWRFLTEGDE